jgi:hypothetical protein
MSRIARYEYLKILEIIHEVSEITRENRDVDTTFTSIISYLNHYIDKSLPISIKISLDGKEFKTKIFNEMAEDCEKREFTLFNGERGVLHVCFNQFSEESKGVGEELKYLSDAFQNLIVKYLNSYSKSYLKEDNEGIGIIDIDSGNNVKSNILSPTFLQKFINKNTYSRDIYHDLTPFKVREILLISSLYDAYSIEREGRFTEHMLGQYGQLNLTSFPRITGASTVSQAFTFLQEKHFDLIIYMVGVDRQTPMLVTEQIKNEYPYIPIFLLLNNNSDVAYFTKKAQQYKYIERVFTWNGDSNIFFSMIKLLEDRVNVENDTRRARVRVILLVEDSPRYYSRYLSFLYKVVMEQTKHIIEDVSTDELYKVLRLRVRPKILLATNFEEAQGIIEKYQDFMLCLITDVKYEKDKSYDENAGIKLLQYTREKLPNLPAIIQSSDYKFAEVAKQYKSQFINKNSETLYENLQDFLTNYLGFGDFVFKNSHGEVIAKASNMREFEKQLKKIPEESLLFHASRDHFSMWLMARGEIKAASIIYKKKVSDFKDSKELRETLLNLIKEHRDERETGNIMPFQEGIDITEDNIYTLAEGSLGGKGRGLAFINALIHNYEFGKHVPDIRIRTPKTFIIGTQEFELFIKNHKLNKIIYEETDYLKLRKIFLKHNLSEELRKKLKHLLTLISKPIAVRSSSLFEDSLTQPFAGIFETYLLPNNHEEFEKRFGQLCDAIKLVFASVFSNTAKGYVKAVNLNIEDEKMAVVLQEVVGNKYDNLYYPHLSGVAQSYNHYPFAHMKPDEGFAVAAVGLGKYVVEGNRAYRFSPKYPNIEINSTKDQFKNSQMKFFAVDMLKKEPDLLKGEMGGLAFEDISIAEKHGTLKHCASVYNPDNNMIYPGISKPGPRIINFANILKYNYIPLAKTLEVVLELGKESMGTDVEIEFAVDLTKDKKGRASFFILQIKPLINQLMECNVNLNNIDKEKIILLSEKGMGNGLKDYIDDVIFVAPEDFDKTSTEEMAEEISLVNEKMLEEKRHYVLIGPGRWGTRDRWIGIPVKWYQISQAKVIVETSLDNFQLDASSGSHFFHNVTNMNVGYFTVQPELGNGYINYDKLKNQQLIYKGKYFTHVRFQKPFNICMDGRKRLYVIYENDYSQEQEQHDTITTV